MWHQMPSPPGSALGDWPAPLLPIHLLWINLVTDSLPALALAMEEGEPNLMIRPPRPRVEGIFTGEWLLLLLAGLLNATCSLGLFAVILHASGNLILARSAALTATIFFQLLIALSSRSRLPLWSMPVFSNRWMIGALGVSILAQILLLTTPLAPLFALMPVPLTLWPMIAVTTLAGFMVFEVAKAVR